jgi:hypothetical protein
VLALETWPGKEDGTASGAAGGGSASLEGEWTPWASLSYRRIARLSGLNKDSVGRAFEQLVASGLAEVRKVLAPRGIGGPKQNALRLHRRLYPAAREPYVKISGHLLYGGKWALLPTPGARHLYLVIACLDRVYNEPGLIATIEAGKQNGYDDQEKNPEQRVARVRGEHPMSLALLSEHSGLSRSTVEEALRVLMQPLHEGRAMLKTGHGRRRDSRWYAPEPSTEHWYWEPDFLNSPGEVERERARRWPGSASRRAQRRAPRRSAGHQTEPRLWLVAS